MFFCQSKCVCASPQLPKTPDFVIFIPPVETVSVAFVNSTITHFATLFVM